MENSSSTLSLSLLESFYQPNEREIVLNDNLRQLLGFSCSTASKANIFVAAFRLKIEDVFHNTALNSLRKQQIDLRTSQN